MWDYHSSWNFSLLQKVNRGESKLPVQWLCDACLSLSQCDWSYLTQNVNYGLFSDCDLFFAVRSSCIANDMISKSFVTFIKFALGSCFVALVLGFLFSRHEGLQQMFCAICFLWVDDLGCFSFP